MKLEAFKSRFENFSLNIYIEMILVILYKVLLDWSIQSVMLKNYIIVGIEKFYIGKFILSLVLTLILYFINEKYITSILTKFFNKVIILIMFIPISTVYIYSEYKFSVYLCLFFEILLIILSSICLQKVKYPFNNIKKKIREKQKYKINLSKVIYGGFWINTIFIIIACLCYNKFPSITALNLKNVYEVRKIFYLPKLIRYLYDFEVKFIIPFFIVFYLHKRKYGKMIIPIIIQLLFFLWKGDKIVLFSIPLVICTYLLFEIFKGKRKDRMFTLGLNVIIIILIILALINLYQPYSYIVRRSLIVPANLKFIYFDFFETNPKIGIYGTIFNAVFKGPNLYGESEYQNIIGEKYFGTETYANTGFLAEGFARWGFIGTLIIPIIFSFILWAMNYALRKNDLSFIVGISILPIYSLNDGYLIPSLTFGAILLLLIICVFFDEKNMNEKGKIYECNNVTR